MFDATIQVVGVEIVEFPEHIQFVQYLGLVLPTPQGPMPIPAGVIRSQFGRDTAITHGRELLEAGERLPVVKKSDLIVANSLAGVDEAVKQNQQLRGQ